MTACSPSALRAWGYLIGAIVLEVAGTSLMKWTQQLSGTAFTAGYCTMLLSVCVSYWLLSIATQSIPIGVAYACWEGLGLALITIASVLLGEHISLLRFLALIAVFAGLACIHLGTSSHAEQQE